MEDWSRKTTPTPPSLHLAHEPHFWHKKQQKREMPRTVLNLNDTNHVPGLEGRRGGLSWRQQLWCLFLCRL